MYNILVESRGLNACTCHICEQVLLLPFAGCEPWHCLVKSICSPWTCNRSRPSCMTRVQQHKQDHTVISDIVHFDTYLTYAVAIRMGKNSDMYRTGELTIRMKLAQTCCNPIGPIGLHSSWHICSRVAGNWSCPTRLHHHGRRTPTWTLRWPSDFFIWVASTQKGQRDTGSLNYFKITI
jgi:hypothetical protein